MSYAKWSFPCFFEANMTYIQNEMGHIKVIEVFPKHALLSQNLPTMIKSIMTTHPGGVYLWKDEFISLTQRVTKKNTNIFNWDFSIPKEGDTISYNHYGFLPDAKPIQWDKIVEWEQGVINDLCSAGVLRKF